MRLKFLKERTSEEVAARKAKKEERNAKSLAAVEKSFPNSTKISDVIRHLEDMIKKEGDDYVYSFSIETLTHGSKTKVIASFSSWSKLMKSLINKEKSNA